MSKLSSLEGIIWLKNYIFLYSHQNQLTPKFGTKTFHFHIMFSISEKERPSVQITQQSKENMGPIKYRVTT